MEIILLSDHALGEAGAVVNVANGFAKNYLFPKKIALPATMENKEHFAKKKQAIEQANLELLNKAKELHAKLVDYQLPNFIRQAADDNKLFGSVSKRNIASLLAEAFPEVTHEHVLLDDPLKYVGVYKVAISVHPKLEKVDLIVNIARSDQEAASALDKFLSGN